MEIEKPKWLTKHFIKKTLENGRDYTITIEDLQISMPVAKGYNYICDIYGAKVEYKKSNEPNKLHKTSLILKSPIKGKIAEDMLELGFMQKEVMLYKELSPKLKLIFGENNNNNNNSSNGVNNFLAESFSSTEENVVILEDLQFKGYRMADRLKQLDYEHCIIALKTLAKFHAGSVILHEREPKLVENIGKEAIFHEELREKFAEFLPNNFIMYSKEFKKWPEVKMYAKWFEENSDKMWDVMVETISPKRNELNVLNHGDYWVSNMLFGYDENNKPNTMIPVDFQVSRYTSPAIDFLNFTYTSVQEDIRTQNYEEFISIYTKELNLNLEKFGSTKYLKESDFRKSLRQRAYLGLFSSLHLLPIVIADPNEINIIELKDRKMDDFKSIDDHPMKCYFSNERYIKILSKRFEEFENMGLISVIP